MEILAYILLALTIGFMLGCIYSDAHWKPIVESYKRTIESYKQTIADYKEWFKEPDMEEYHGR